MIDLENLEKIDRMDIEIISKFQSSFRITYKEIAKELGVSIGTIYNRISKLIGKGIIEQFSIVVNDAKLGYYLNFLIFLQIDNGYLQKTLEKLKERKEILSIFSISGKNNVLLICRFKNLNEVQEFIIGLNKEREIHKVISNIALKIHKNRLNIELEKEL